MSTGVIRLRTADGEEYQWSKVTSTVGNLIIGKLYVDHGGVMRVRNMGTGLTAKLKFKEQGLIMDRNPHQVPCNIQMQLRAVSSLCQNTGPLLQ